jgi:glycosyltransferase involved in cell wall biosynthesis
MGTEPRPLRLLYVEQTRPHFTGAPKATLDLLGGLAGNGGIETDVVTCGAPSDAFHAYAATKGLRTVRLYESKRFVNIGSSGLWRVSRLVSAAPTYFYMRRLLKKYISSTSPDCLLVTGKKTFWLALPAIKRCPDMKVLCWYNDLQIDRAFLKERWNQHVDRFLCLGQVSRRLSIEAGFDGNKIGLLTNSFDRDAFSARMAESSTAEIPDTSRPIRVLQTGTLVPRKRPLVSIEALAHLVKRGHDAVLYLAGPALPQAEDYHRQLHERANRDDIKGRVHFLGWRDDIPQLLKHATVFVLPSEREGMPLSILEAMAAGVPVVATPIAGVPEMLDDGRAGQLVSVDNPGQLADAIDMIHKDHSMSKELTEKACERLSTTYTSDIQKQQFTNELSLALADGTATS